MNYDTNLLKIFQFALNQEKTGMNFFSNALNMMGIGEAVTAFKTLVAEEQKHIIFIERIIKDITQTGEVQIETIKQETTAPSDFFTKRAQSEFLQECLQNSMVPDVTVFNTAWLIEKDISEFYGRMADKSKGRAKESFEMLADWERGHEKYFREYHDRLSRLYSDMSWGG